ncbi:MAG: acyl carrier protein [Fimbriimonadaceae bacterium]|nr:acyl carrier protein [Fimbriimonadaceae bacterium]
MADQLTPEDVLLGVREVSADVLRVPLEKVEPTSRFIEDLDVDSLYVVQLAIALEDRFSITVPEDEAQTVKTVQEMADLVSSKLSA